MHISTTTRLIITTSTLLFVALSIKRTEQHYYQHRLWNRSFALIAISFYCNVFNCSFRRCIQKFNVIITSYSKIEIALNIFLGHETIFLNYVILKGKWDRISIYVLIVCAILNHILFCSIVFNVISSVRYRYRMHKNKSYLKNRLLSL